MPQQPGERGDGGGAQLRHLPGEGGDNGGVTRFADISPVAKLAR